MKSCIEEFALNAVHNGIIMIDRDALVTFCNDAACQLIGIPRKEIIGQKLKSIIPETKLDQVLEKGVPQLHKQVKLKDRVIISNRTPLIEDGKIVGAVAIFEDVTDLKEALKELTTTKEFLQKLETGLEHLPEGIIMVDTAGYITSITNSYCEFLGVKKEQVIGKHVTKVIENTRMHEVVQTGIPEIGDMQRIKDKDVVVMRIPIRVNGEIVGAIGQLMFQDVSDLTKLAAKLQITEKKLEYYKQEYQRWQKSRYSIKNIIGKSQEVIKLKEMVNKVAQYHSTILLRGESGTGKELIAHAIHEASNRGNAPFVRVNCAAIPKELLEAELFGYEEGSFTGAKKKGKPGKFELAEGGTIFLDEIGDMPLEMQVKLLRVLQEKEVERVGGAGVIPIDARVIASTNRNLEQMIAQKNFRYDLYYRLNVVTLLLPNLREMREDIEAITDYLIEQLNEEFGTRVDGISEEVRSLFMSYNWPGNVRELRNTLERAVNVIEGTRIRLKDLPIYLQELDQQPHRLVAGDSMLNREIETAEKKAIVSALKKANYNKLKAARLLDVHRATLYRKMQKYGIQA